MTLLKRKKLQTEDGLAPKPRKWPAILGVTAAAWALLSGVLLLLLGHSGQ
ncbi:MAG: hypothetical protein JWM82_3911 [Myxococcales bacterium]|nr:hypothetical protein [Myxococcales bacterium]